MTRHYRYFVVYPTSTYRDSFNEFPEKPEIHKALTEKSALKPKCQYGSQNEYDTYTFYTLLRAFDKKEEAEKYMQKYKQELNNKESVTEEELKNILMGLMGNKNDQ